MRATTVLATALLLSAPLLALAPAASAFGWCSNAVPGRECWSHWTCVGLSRDYTTHTEWCQYEVPDPTDPCGSWWCIRDPCDWLLYCCPYCAPVEVVLP